MEMTVEKIVELLRSDPELRAALWRAVALALVRRA